MASNYIPQTDRFIHQCDFVMSGFKALTLTHKAEPGVTMNHVYRSVKRQIHTYLKTSVLNEVKFIAKSGEILNTKTLRLKRARKSVKPTVRLNGKTPPGVVHFLNLVDPRVIVGGCFLDVDALTAVP